MKRTPMYMRRPVATLLGSLVALWAVAAGCGRVFLGSGLRAQALQGVVEAVCACAMLAVVAPGVLPKATSSGRKTWRNGGRGGIASVVIGVLLVGALGGMGSFCVMRASGSVADAGAIAANADTGVALAGALPVQTLALRAALAVAVCLTTALFEESVFRGIAVSCSYCAFKGQNSAHPAISAALLSAVLFGLLHMTDVPVDGLSSGIDLAQVAAKGIQAMLFGFCMAALLVRRHSIVAPVAVHAAFDMLYLGPAMACAAEVPATFVTGNAIDLAILLLMVVLLLLPAGKSLQWLGQDVIPYDGPSEQR